MLNDSKLEYSESPNIADDSLFDCGEPKPPRPDVLTSCSTTVDSQSDELDFQPKFWKLTGYFQEISVSAISVQKKSRPTAEFQEKSQPADHFQEKSRPADDFQEKSRSKADVPEKSRAGKINRPTFKMFTSSSAAPATAFSWWRRKKPQKILSDVPAKEDLAVHLRWVKKRFSLKELQVATDSFSKKNILGRGGFGEVYKGRLADGSLVAVKRLKEERKPGGELQFLKEVEMTSMPTHRNLLRLLGFCMTPTKRLLVYPFMANGSVASWLRERPESQPPLDWPTRKRIALGSATGLSYLHDHCVPKIIHRDVKTANILLDEEFEAVVGDFGLAKSIDYRDTHVITAVGGTIGHIAPECPSTGKSSEKADVYGYGIMLLELITGKGAFDLARLGVKRLLKEKKLAMLVDPDMKNNYVESEVEQLIQVALLCIQSSPMDRPMMAEVVRMLEGDWLAERWNKWQKVELTLDIELSGPTDNLDAIELWRRIRTF